MKPKPIKTTQITGLWSYLETIDWSEPWFMGLLGFHLLTCLITFLTMKRLQLQAIHFTLLLVIVYYAEQINEVAAMHYDKFSRQQYFDSKGMFISLVLSAPILLNCLLIVMYWIFTSSQMMVVTGRLKLEQQKRLRDKQEAQEKKKK